jgi:hypothetical protein
MKPIDKNNKNIDPALIRTVIGLLFILLPFFVMSFVDITHAVRRYYITHNLEVGINTSISAHNLAILLVSAPIFVGSLFVAWAKGHFKSKMSLVKIPLLIITCIILTYACFFYSFVRYINT